MARILLWHNGANKRPMLVEGKLVMLPSQDAVQFAVLEEGSCSAELLGRLDLLPEEAALAERYIRRKLVRTGRVEQRG